jgi:hypothetical protein
VNIVDQAVLARLRTNGALHVHDEQPVYSKNPLQPVRVDVPMPYIVYASAVGDDDNRRLSGRRLRRSVPFYLTYVGLSRAQTKMCGEAARELLEAWIPDLEDDTILSWRCGIEESQRIRPDFAAVTPDGTPTYQGIDGYAVSIMLAPVPAI